MSIRPTFFNHETLEVDDSDLKAVADLVEKLNPPWWVTDRHHQFLAYAFKLGRESNASTE